MSMICELFAAEPGQLQAVLAEPESIYDLLRQLQGQRASISLEKSWHGLHFALTGSAWEGDPPLNFLVTGGTPVGEEDVGYGPARVLDAQEVQAVHTALTALSLEDFARNFDLEQMAAQQVYPGIWDEPRAELLEEYGDYLQELKAFLARAATNGQGVIVAIR